MSEVAIGLTSQHNQRIPVDDSTPAAPTVPVSMAALPLPAGAATSALQTSIGTAAHTDSAAILAKLNGSVDVTTDGGSVVATEASLSLIYTAISRLAGFETLTAISYGGGDQTNITDGSNGIWINTAGALKIDTWGGATGVTFTVVVGLFPQRRVKKIYQTGSSAAGFIGYPPA